MGGAPPPPLGFAPQGSKKCHFWHFLGGPLEGVPEGPVRAPNPEDPARGGGGALTHYPPPASPGGGPGEPGAAPSRDHSRGAAGRGALRTPGGRGGGPGTRRSRATTWAWRCPRAPERAERGSPPSGGVGSSTVPRGPDITGSRSGPAPEARSGSGSSAALGWSRGDCPPWCRRHETGGLGVSPISSPHPYGRCRDPGTGSLSKCGSQTPDTGVRGYPGPRPHSGLRTPMPGGPPGGGSRGAPGGPAPGGENFRAPGAPRKSFRKFRTGPETGPGPGTPKTALLGPIYSQNRPIWGVRRGYPPDHVSGTPVRGVRKKWQFCWPFNNSPSRDRSALRDFWDSWDSWTWDSSPSWPRRAVWLDWESY